ncbi:MAG: dihydroorotase [Planctomycetes bacterium]|nr:dihydroorotase [Planctomycetota bacterium]
MEWERESVDAFVIRNARVIDPFSERDEVSDVVVVDGIVATGTPRDAMVIDGSGLIVCPGLLDIHVHLREPGQTHKETIATGTAAAAAGGFTFVAAMPNTQPPVDNPDIVAAIRRSAHQADHCEVGPVAAITQGRHGRAIVDFESLAQAGAVAFSDDGTGVEDDQVMREAFRAAARVGSVLIQHCEYVEISAGGVMHLGEISRRLGFPGLDPRSEEAMIERDLELCEETGGRYHVAHISTARAVEMVRNAKNKGLPVTTEVCPHHLILTDEACANADPNTKMHPPLRRDEDVEACRTGLVDGTIDCIATDHAPHGADEKAKGFLSAPPGIVGLETAIPLARLAMIESGLADWADLVRWFSKGPAEVLGLGRPPIQPGHSANLTVLDPNRGWKIDPATFRSKSRNTPFAGWDVIGRAWGSIRGRCVLHDPGDSQRRPLDGGIE